MITIMRLKNAPAGAPYAIERIDDLTPESAGKLATSWWESRGTLSLLVIHDGKEDSRYAKEYADVARYPEDWPRGRKVPAAPKPLPATTGASPVARPAPTLANEPVRPGEKRELCPTCNRTTGEKREPDGVHVVCGACGMPFTCTTCMTPRLLAGRHEGDDDPTPSGRLANHRCPACGIAMHRRSQREIWDMYVRRRK